MTVLERVAYLRGLYEGLEIDTGKKEGKLLAGMLETMEELAQSVTDLQEQNNGLLNELDDIYEELSAITEDFLDEEEDDLEMCIRDSKERFVNYLESSAAAYSAY